LERHRVAVADVPPEQVGVGQAVGRVGHRVAEPGDEFEERGVGHRTASGGRLYPERGAGREVAARDFRAPFTGLSAARLLRAIFEPRLRGFPRSGVGPSFTTGNAGGPVTACYP